MTKVRGRREGHVAKVLWVYFAAVALCLPICGQGAKTQHGNSHPANAHAANVQPAAVVPAEAQSVLAAMVTSAAVIFAGHVVSIAPGNGFVDVTFRIEEPVRGGSKLGVYVLREWAGLWSGAPDRYHVGERLLLLLAARGPSGMSAPVGGDEGIVPILAGAVQPLADPHGNAPAEDGSLATDITGMTADLRRVQARAVRPLLTGTLVQASSAAGPGVGWGAVAPLNNLGDLAGQPTVAAVLALLRTAAGYVPGPGSGHEAQ